MYELRQSILLQSKTFFTKLGALYARFNLLGKPMQVYNVDESGLNVMQHKGKVVADVKRGGVHCVVASEKGTNHTIVTCGSASGYILPRMNFSQEFVCLKPSKQVHLLVALLLLKKKGLDHCQALSEMV